MGTSDLDMGSLTLQAAWSSGTRGQRVGLESDRKQDSKPWVSTELEAKKRCTIGSAVSYDGSGTGMRQRAGSRNRVGSKPGVRNKAGRQVADGRVCSSSKPGSTLLHRQLSVALSGLSSVPSPISMPELFPPRPCAQTISGSKDLRAPNSPVSNRAVAGGVVAAAENLQALVQDLQTITALFSLWLWLLRRERAQAGKGTKKEQQKKEPPPVVRVAG
ncbi:unnamed protein product [Caretta caretta]